MQGKRSDGHSRSIRGALPYCADRVTARRRSRPRNGCALVQMNALDVVARGEEAYMLAGMSTRMPIRER
jgi:hypothetical protein